ncbi:hypothetical protein EZV62_022959 [Acer yangbiense]|uniref:Uncharacterized protein n=1 Tax=Acer yangbiense TaxID=1000413 RepID=A0A5C7H0Z3_9ROSI|nr:hypothetical protein EZV62_022959 [Acer yangbiense]
MELEASDLDKPEVGKKPDITEELEAVMPDKEPEVGKKPDITEEPEAMMPDKEPELGKKPDITEEPEAMMPDKEPELGKKPDITEEPEAMMPDKEPELGKKPDITEEPEAMIPNKEPEVFRPLLNITAEFSAEEFETTLITPKDILSDIHIIYIKGCRMGSSNCCFSWEIKVDQPVRGFAETVEKKAKSTTCELRILSSYHY